MLYYSYFLYVIVKTCVHRNEVREVEMIVSMRPESVCCRNKFCEFVI